MRKKIASRIMRTTIDIDAPVLAELKAVGKREGKSLGRLVSDLLASALAGRRQPRRSSAPPLRWVSKSMRARVDLNDRDAVYEALESDRS